MGRFLSFRWLFSPGTAGRSRGIRQRLTWLVLFCVVPVWFVAGFMVYYSFQTKRDDESRAMLELARFLAIDVDRELASVKAALEGLATSPAFHHGDLATIHRQARLLIRRFPGADIIVSDATAQQLVNSYRPLGAPLPKRNTPETVNRIFRTARPVVSNLYYGAVTGRPLIAVDIPVIHNGRVTYDLSMTLPATHLSSMINNYRLSNGRCGMLIDAKESVIGTNCGFLTHGGHWPWGRVRSAMRRAREGISGGGLFEKNSMVVAFCATSVAEWTVLVGMRTATLEAESYRWLWGALAGTLILSLSGVAMALVMGHTIASAIRSLVAPATALGRGEHLEETASSGLEEVDSVAESLYLTSLALREHREERDRAETALRKSENKLLRAQKIAAMGSWEWDPETDAVEYTDELFTIFGVSREQFGGNFTYLLESVIHPDDRDLVRQAGETALRTGAGQTIEYRIIRPDGRLRWIRAVGEFIYGQDKLVKMVGANQDITERKQAEIELRAYARRLLDVEEALRKTIASELHDEIGRDLTVLGINLTIAASNLPSGVARELHSRIKDSGRLVENISRTVRTIMATLRPPVLDDYGLAAALRWFGDVYARRTGIDVALNVDDDFPRLEAEREIVLFRIAQEALTNVAKYAAASLVTISLHRDGRGAIRFEVADDGKGFDAAAGYRREEVSGWGMTIMRERAELIGGMFIVESLPGRGTTVAVALPGEGNGNGNTGKNPACR